jgi:formiminotetrahydrofolate cyclodeaminase
LLLFLGAAIGAAAAQMAAAYTTRIKDVKSGAAQKGEVLISSMNVEQLLQAADDDAAAYSNLQRTWKETDMPADEKAAIEARALQVPTVLLETCHAYILSIQTFLPDCNPNITSDAKVGIHQLAGAARAAYQTVLVNSPPADEKERLKSLIKEIRTVEDELLDL